MSWMVLAWAETAPVASPYEWIILNRMAARVDPDGEGCYLSPKTIANGTKVDVQTIKTHMGNLVERGVLRLGDQSRASHIPANRRPNVYDLLVPLSFYSAKQLEEVNRFRAENGRPPLDASSRPDLAEPEATRKRRSDLGVPKPAKGLDPLVQPMNLDDAGTLSTSGNVQGDVVHPPTEIPGVSTRPPQGDVVDPPRGMYETPNSLRTTPEENSREGYVGGNVTSARANAGQPSSKPSPSTGAPRKADWRDRKTWHCAKHLALVLEDPGAYIPSCGPCASVREWCQDQVNAAERALEVQARQCQWHDAAGWVLDPETRETLVPAVRCDHATPPAQLVAAAAVPEPAELEPTAARAAAMAEARRVCKPAKPRPSRRRGRGASAERPQPDEGAPNGALDGAGLASGQVGDAPGASVEAETVGAVPHAGVHGAGA